LSDMIYNFPPAIHFGWGEAENVAGHVKDLKGTKVLIVTDEGCRKVGLLKDVVASLEGEGVPYEAFDGVQPNPTDTNVMEGLSVYREAGCDTVLAVGGGSPIDAAKGVILMANHPGRLEEYYRGAAPRRPVTGDVPPFIAVPTTSGTGSETSRGGIITDTRENRKRAIGSRHLLPKAAVLDPSLTVSMPPRLTAHTGLDALSHSLEALAVDRYAPLADAFAWQGIRLVADSLVKAFDDGGDRRAREDMMMASTMGSLAFSKGLGVVHSMAHQLSPQTGMPHGAACGVMLPHAIRFNLAEGPAKERVAIKYAEAARIFGADGEGMTAIEFAGEAADVVCKLLLRLEVEQRLSVWGVTEEDIGVMAPNAMLDHCHPRNPRPCAEEDMVALLREAL
jgi:4-hydroxybutyrate dehydrogenase